MARMLGRALDGKHADTYRCCGRHNPGSTRRSHAAARQYEDRQWRAEWDDDEQWVPVNSSCPTCGLTDCPDDDPEGRACPIIHDGVPYTCGCGSQRVGGDGHAHTLGELPLAR